MMLGLLLEFQFGTKILKSNNIHYLPWGCLMVYLGNQKNLTGKNTIMNNVGDVDVPERGTALHVQSAESVILFSLPEI